MKNRFGPLTLAVTLAGAPAAGSVAISSPPGKAPASSCRADAATVCLGRVDSGRSRQARVGQSVRLDLSGAGLVWRSLRETGPALREIGRQVSTGTGLTATYRAVSAGRAEFIATAGPKCTPGQACPQFLLLWRVEVVVSR